MRRWRRLLSAMLAVVLAGSIPASGTSGFAWQYFSAIDPQSDQPRFALVYGLPETDAVQFIAQCSAGGGMATIEIGSDIGALPNGAAASIAFSAGGFDRTYAGSVIGVGAETGVTGVGLALSLNDPLWFAIRDRSQLSYGVAGRGSNVLPLNGSGGPTTQFLNSCAGGASAGGGDKPGGAPAVPPAGGGDKPGGAPAAPAAGGGDKPGGGNAPAAPQGSGPGGSATAGQLQLCVGGSARTVDTGAAVTVTFVNSSDGVRGILWVDGNGVPIDYSTLNPGESVLQPTFGGHVWMITDGPGNCLQYYVAANTSATVTLTGSGGDFGPE